MIAKQGLCGGALISCCRSDRYAPALTAMTQGRASFHMEFSHYEIAPKTVQDKIIAEAERKKEESG